MPDLNTTPDISSQPLGEKNPTQYRRKNSLVIIVSILVSLLILGLVYYLYLKNKADTYITNPFSQQLSTQPNNSLITDRLSAIRGKILKIEGTTLIIKNVDGIVGNLPLADKFVVFKYDANSKKASLSSNLSDIQLNRSATISLVQVNGSYEVNMIRYTYINEATVSAKTGT